MKTLTLILLLPIFLLSQTAIEKHPENPVLDVGLEGSWDSHAVKTPNVVVDGTTCKMWYSGSDGMNTRIGYATSPDGIAWAIADDVNPVLDLGAVDSWDDEGASAPCVIFDGEIYKMWYHGSDGLTYRIGYATSSDGINWNKHENPVLEKGIEGSWDGGYVFRPKVISTDNEYSMYYAGYNGAEQVNIGLAKSIDGINWTKDSLNPVMVASQDWEENQIAPGEILINNGIYSIWYTGGRSGSKLRSGYATSVDGKNWNKNATYVLDWGAFGEWDRPFASIGSACFDGSTYHLWYDSYDKYDITGAIGYATSDVDSPTVVNEKISVPVKYELSQNFPNPFNPSTIIKYSIPNESNVILKVFDILSRQVATLVNKEQPQGNYEVEFDATKLTSGIYFYKLQAGDYVETKKMILLK